jgi:UDP-N-acetylmuramate dehydrogenase
MMSYGLLEQASLQGRSTFQLPARARLLADVGSVDALNDLYAGPHIALMPTLVLGGGSNTVFAGDFDGLVIAPSLYGIAELSRDRDSVLIEASASENWNDLVGWTLARGYFGLENLALIPGTVGAAPIQNIGAYGVELSDVLESIQVFDCESRQVLERSREELELGYRDSRLKREPGRWIVLKVRLRLSLEPRLRLDYAGVREMLASLGVESATPIWVAEAITRLRLSKLPDPGVLPNAGSFFKNPVLPLAQADTLKSEHATVSVYPVDAHSAKLSAAWLIENAGWKGRREGDIAVSEQHALVLVNHGRGTGEQLKRLVAGIVESVQSRFGITLEPEPRVIG